MEEIIHVHQICLQFYIRQINIFDMYFLFLCLVTICFSLNIIQGGDFQWFPPLTNINDEWKSQFQLLPSSSTLQYGWYTINHDYFQVRRKYNVQTTNCADLTADYPTSVCQQISLVIGKKYRLGYSLYCDQKFQKMTAIAKVNSKIVSFLYIPTNLSFGQKFDFFQAETSLNEICFSEQHQIRAAYLNFSTFYWGGLIDNITLEETFFYSLLFSMKISENMSFVVLKSNLSLQNSEAVDQFQKQYRLEYDSLSSVQIIYNYFDDNFYSIGIYSNIGFLLNLVKFVPNITLSSNEIITFEVNIDSNISSFGMDKRQEYFLLDTQSLLKILVENINYSIKLARFSLFTSLVINFMGFPYLSLFYVFLGIHTIPEFTRQLYYDLLKLTFVDQSLGSVLEKVGICLPKIRINKEDDLIPQVVQPNKGNYKWFGSFGVSSLLINNNIDFLMLLCLFFLKLIVIKILIGLWNKLIPNKIVKEPNFLQLFILQVSANFPSICISAVQRDSAPCSGTFQRFQKIIQVLILFLCVLVPFIFWIYLRVSLRKRERKDKMKKEKKTLETRKKIKEFYQNLSNLILLVVIPLSICLNQPLAFFSITFTSIIVRLLILLKYIGYTESQFEKVTIVLSHIVEVIHHCLFFSLYFISKKSVQQIHFIYGDIIIWIGLGTVLSIICIWSIEVVKILISLTYRLRTFRDQIKNCCKRSEKQIHPNIILIQGKVKKEEKLIVENIEVMKEGKNGVEKKGQKSCIKRKKVRSERIQKEKLLKELGESKNQKKKRVVFQIQASQIM